MILVATACSSTNVAQQEPANSSGDSSPATSTQIEAGSSGRAVPPPSTQPKDEAPDAKVTATLKPQGDINDPPRHGTYTYRQDGYQTFGALRFNFDPEGSFVVQKPQREGRTARQVTIRRYAESRERETLTLFRSDAILLEQAVERLGSGATQQTVTCRTPEPVPILPIPWRVGGTWRGGGECSGLVLDYEATLRAVEKRIVSGVSVRTLVVDAEYTIRGEDLEQRTSSTIWFTPDHRMVIRQVESTEGTYQGAAFERELTEELVSLIPN